MADYQFPGQNQWSEKPAIGTGEGESPLAPAPQNEITMRTMASDATSIKEMGGGDPRPYVPSVAQVSQTQPNQKIPDAPSPTNITTNSTQTAEIPVIPLPPKKSGNIFIVLAVIIIVLGLGAIGYFYVYPQFISPSDTNVITETPQTSEPTIPAIVETTTETTSTTSTVPVIEVPPITGLDSHVSLFKTPADFSSETTLSSETVAAIKEAWKGTTVEVPVFKETVFKNTAGAILGESKLIPLFLPSFITASSSPLFEEDFTLFTYTDQKGVWPGIILKAKGDSLVLAKEESKKIEANTDWQSLFMLDPGKEQMWKDGKVGTALARYISFATKGNALSYTWFDNILLISTSYQGAQDAAKRLGF
jgi:hypothetical protein